MLTTQPQRVSKNGRQRRKRWRPEPRAWQGRFRIFIMVDAAPLVNPIEENAMFKYGKDDAGQWRWRFVARNRRTIAVSSESYHNEADCLNSINIIRGSGSAPIERE